LSPFLWSRTKLARAVLTVWLFALFAGLASGVTTFADGRVAQHVVDLEPGRDAK
jgi:hypothetical protein